MMNVKKTRRITMLLGMVLLLSVVLAACVNTDNVEEIMDTSYATGQQVVSDVTSEDDEISTPEGATEAPKVVDVVNIAPYTVAISGTCESGATIRLTGAKEDVETTANGGYYIIQAELMHENNLLTLTAQVEGKEVSPEREVVASYNATADKLLNGNSVSVGADSRLYFDKMVADASGENLYTASQLNTIKDYVNNTASSYYYDRAGAQKVELIYCLIPNVTTVYPEIFPEGMVEDSYTTIYDQVVETLGETQATVIDMREIYQDLRDDSSVANKYGGIYRVTDSSLTDYGAYLAYSEIMKKVEANFPDAAPRAVSEFDWSKVTANGGNLVNYRELTGSVITEEIVVGTPKFDLGIGQGMATSPKINALLKFADVEDGDYSFFTKNDANDEISGIAERWIIDTQRNSESLTLPNAIIYRDYGALAFSDILAERFEKSVLVASGDHTINLSEVAQYKRDGQKAVDYIIVIISEENMDTAFNAAFAN